MRAIYYSHLHMGLLSEDVLISPNEIKSFIKRYGVKGGLILPTAHVGGNDNLELHETLYKAALEEKFQIALYLNTDVLNRMKDGHYEIKYSFSAFKIHPEAVEFSDKDLNDVCIAIGMKNKPLLIHTGGLDCSHASRFESIIRKYKQQTFIMCHGRPTEEAFTLLNKYDNVWIDTSFMSIDRAKPYITKSNEDRILFGSDFPINRWFPELPNDEFWYKKQIDDILGAFPLSVSEKILETNYLKLFCKDCGCNSQV